MRARGMTFLCLLVAGCYDVDELSRSFDGGDNPGGDGGVSDAAPDAFINIGGWRQLSSPTTNVLRGVFGDGSGEVFAVGSKSTVVRAAVTHAAVAEVLDPGYALRSVWATGGSAFAVGDEGTVLVRGNNEVWTGNSGVIGDNTQMTVFGTSATNVVTAGSGGQLAHFMGSAWAPEDSSVVTSINGLWSRTSGDWLAVGEAGMILRGSGTGALTWVGESSGVTTDLYGVWASATDAYAVGFGGVVLHSSGGGTWAAETSGTSVDLFGVFGAGDQVWAVGAEGTIINRTGGAWRVERSGGADLRAVWASGPSDAWAVGNAGTLLRRAP